MLIVFFGIYLIRLARAAQRNHKTISSLSVHERKKLTASVFGTRTRHLAIGGAVTRVPWWAAVLVVMFIFAAIFVAVINMGK